uniref:Uncharacterized protein n=1 Tax=Anguilla anguilla TaxID=7936 RepID=A0A0E9XW95_ANGAN
MYLTQVCHAVPPHYCCALSGLIKKYTQEQY